MSEKCFAVQERGRVMSFPRRAFLYGWCVMMPDASIAELEVVGEMITQEYVRHDCQERAAATTRRGVTNLN